MKCDSSIRSQDPSSQRIHESAIHSPCWSERILCTLFLIAQSVGPISDQWIPIVGNDEFSIFNHKNEVLWFLGLTISAWAWYCIVTIPMNIWLHWSSKQLSTSLTSSSLVSLHNKESKCPKNLNFLIPNFCRVRLLC